MEKNLYFLMATAVFLFGFVLLAPSPSIEVELDVYNYSGESSVFYPESSYIYFDSALGEKKMNLYGYYQGQSFSRGLENGTTGDKAFMLTDTIDPENGVMEGLLVPRPQNGSLQITFFVDQEFLNATRPVKIAYGVPEPTVIPAEFSRYSPGVYTANFTYRNLTFRRGTPQITAFIGRINQTVNGTTEVTGFGTY